MNANEFTLLDDIIINIYKQLDTQTHRHTELQTSLARTSYIFFQN